MSISMSVLSTEFVYVGVTGTPPTSVSFAFKLAGVNPTAPDWSSGHVISSTGDPLWADAVASGATGDYYVSRLVGPYAGTESGVVLTANDYQVWIQLTGPTERPVRIAPVSLTIS